MNSHLSVVTQDAPSVFEGDLAEANFQGRSSGVGTEFKHVARDFLKSLGAEFARGPHAVGVYPIEGVVAGPNGQQFMVIAHGVLDDTDTAGLRRTDTIKKAGFDAAQLRHLRRLPVLLITSHLPKPGTAAETQLADSARDIFDVVATNDDFEGIRRLLRYLHDDPRPQQLPARWRENPSVWTPELFDGDDVDIPITVHHREARNGDGTEGVDF